VVARAARGKIGFGQAAQLEGSTGVDEEAAAGIGQGQAVPHAVERIIEQLALLTLCVLAVLQLEARLLPPPPRLEAHRDVVVDYDESAGGPQVARGADGAPARKLVERVIGPGAAISQILLDDLRGGAFAEDAPSDHPVEQLAMPGSGERTCVVD